MLVLAGSPSRRLYLIELADAITHGKGFLTVASILERANLSEGKIDELRAFLLTGATRLSDLKNVQARCQESL